MLGCAILLAFFPARRTAANLPLAVALAGMLLTYFAGAQWREYRRIGRQRADLAATCERSGSTTPTCARGC